MNCLLLVGRKNQQQQKREATTGAFFTKGQTRLAGCAMQDFCGC
jgi:hypothetical protein